MSAETASAAWSEFFAVPENVTVWQILDSQFLTTAFIIVVTITLWVYDRRAKAAVERADGLQKLIEYIESARDREEVAEAELPDEIPAQPAAPDHRQEATRVVQQAKDFLEERVSQDGDGRHHRTYEKIPRYDYTVLAVALYDRKQINEIQLDAAVKLFSEWKRYARGRAANKTVPGAVFEMLQTAYRTLTGNGL